MNKTFRSVTGWIGKKMDSEEGRFDGVCHMCGHDSGPHYFCDECAVRWQNWMEPYVIAITTTEQVEWKLEGF